MAIIQVKVINKGHQQPPAYATSQSVGMDLRANIDTPIVLRPMERGLIPTGLHITLPVGFEIQVRSRSDLALKHGLTAFNSPGTINADYRGEIMVLLINFSDGPFIINDGEHIAQMVIAHYEQVESVEVEEFDGIKRDEGGYGHTGVK